MKKNETAVIVLAAGKGMRFTGLKQFLKIKGRPLLSITVETLLGYKLGSIIVLIVPEDKVLYTKRLYKNSKEVVVLAGGTSRCESTKIGITYLSDKNCRFVFIHDAVRPFVKKINFLNLKKVMLKEGTAGALLFLPITDSVVLYKTENSKIVHLDKTNLRTTQTPHLYKYEALVSAFNFVNQDLENSQLMELSDNRLSYVLGSRENIKLTYKMDIQFFKQKLQ